MTKDELCKALNNINTSREKRSMMANKIENNPHLIPILIAIIKENSDPISCKASWVLEYVTKNNLQLILNNIDAFITILTSLTLESSIRPASKICLLLVEDFYSKKSINFKQSLSQKHLNLITEAAFDWLIGSTKVAPKAYSMTTLLLLGLSIDWIHLELQQILKQNYEGESAAYKARARMTLKSLKKFNQKN